MIRFTRYITWGLLTKGSVVCKTLQIEKHLSRHKCVSQSSSLLSGALKDLDQAISLSGSTGRTACQALVQRGLLHRLACQDSEAREDFEKAAVLGSEFARQQAVVLNPYAALCNKMLSKVINQLRNPEVSETQLSP